MQVKSGEFSAGWPGALLSACRDQSENPERCNLEIEEISDTLAACPGCSPRKWDNRCDFLFGLENTRDGASLFSSVRVWCSDQGFTYIRVKVEACRSKWN